MLSKHMSIYIKIQQGKYPSVAMQDTDVL